MQNNWGPIGKKFQIIYADRRIKSPKNLCPICDLWPICDLCGPELRQTVPHHRHVGKLATAGYIGKIIIGNRKWVCGLVSRSGEVKEAKWHRHKRSKAARPGHKQRTLIRPVVTIRDRRQERHPPAGHTSHACHELRSHDLY